MGGLAQILRAAVHPGDERVLQSGQVGRFRGGRLFFEPRRQRRQRTFDVRLVALGFVKNHVGIVNLDDDGRIFHAVRLQLA